MIVNRSIVRLFALGGSIIVPRNRSISRLYQSRSSHEADDTSKRLGVASQSDVASDRVYAEKASPTR